jgi:hypothetical protein
MKAEFNFEITREKGLYFYAAVKIWWFTISAGWFNGNEFKILSIDLFHIFDDYPKGWSGVAIVQLNIAKLEAGVYLDNKSKKR